MRRGVEHLMTHRAAGLPLKPGGRKTSITLAAFCGLQAQGAVKTMLVIAPLRVCRQVWRQEGAKWTQFKHLRFGLLHGTKKEEVLRKWDSDIYLINPEGVAWLCKQYFGRPLPFDIVCIDELTRFKNHQSERSKALRPRIDRTPWRWGLTGSLAPNGYLDIFGQQLMLDGGAALGKYITHYRDQYFQVDFNGFDYTLMPGAEKRITAKIAPYWMYVDESDYSQLPPLVDNVVTLELDKATRATYEKMKRDMLAELPEGVVTAANQAACYSKLSQMANGAVYVGDHKQATSHIHDLKLDAIEELLEELAGEPLLVGYEFNHDLERLRARFGVVDPTTKQKVLPYLGKGTTAAQESQWIAAWNRGELPLLCCHPASAGHGLNLQEGNAANVAWFGITWDFELYDQFIRRIWRSGNTATQLFNHLLIVRGTIDELKLEALRDKDMTQTRLLRALNTQILREITETQAGGVMPGLDDRRLPNMVARLSRQNEATAQPLAPTGSAEPIKPRGWGQAGNAEPSNTGAPGQRERIQEQIRQQPQDDPHAGQQSPQDQARSAFSGGVREAAAAVEATDYGVSENTASGVPVPQEQPATTGRRRTRAAPPAPVWPQQGQAEAMAAALPGVDLTVVSQAIENAGLMKARAVVLQAVFANPDETLEGGLEMARSLMDFVTRG